MYNVSVMLLVFFICFPQVSSGEGFHYGWYTEGDYIPSTRVKVVVKNVLDFDRTTCPVIITRQDFPIPDISDFFALFNK